LDVKISEHEQELAEELEALYQAPERHYHSVIHINNCLQAFRSFCNSTAGELALLFHDAVYRPGGQDNEAQSAALLKVWGTKLGWPVDLIEEAAGLVLVTGTWKATTLVEKSVLDADFWILGANEEVYDDYLHAIRREYVPFVCTDAEFNKGRSDFIERLLRRPRIYLGDFSCGVREGNARINLIRELKYLAESL
jgi:predicted metal-dependent HD superfamily phosphohydrolase